MRFIVKLFRTRLINQRWLRVVALSAVLLSVSLFFALRRANASVGEALTSVGEHLMQIPEGRYGNPVQPIEVNGIQLMFQTAHANVPYEQVVKRFERACVQKGGMTDAEFGKAELNALQGLAADTNPHAAPAHGVFVQEGPRGTIVACIDTNGVPWLSHEMLDRLKTFRKEGDLHAIGVFRFALVKKTPYGAHFLTMWSGRSTPLLKMFPKHGDVPGAEHAFVPRITGSRRVISSAANGYQVLAYEYPERPLNAVIDESEASYKAAGFAYKDLGGDPHGARFWVSRGDDQVFVVFAERRGRVTSTVVDVPK